MKRIDVQRRMLCSVVLMLFFMSSAVLAQTELTQVYGKIINSENKKPLEAVSLNLSDSNIGTITNSEGDFVLKLPQDTSDSNVVISLLGFYTRVLSVSELSSNRGPIKLTPKITQLSEVSISTYQNANELIRKVFEKRLQNVEKRTAYMTAFYRETIKRRNRNVSLTEAVVNILKQPYNSANRDVIKLNKSRKSTDYKRLDTVSLKLQGGPFSSLYLDIMKYPEFIFDEESITTYNFSFDTPTSINNKDVYVVNFSPRSNSYNIGYQGQLFIDMNSLGLVSAKYSIDVSNRSKTRNLLVKRKPRDIVVYPLEANYKVDYQQKNGKWYFNYSNIFLKFKVKKKRALFNKVYSLSSEIAVTDWKINNDIRIANKERLSPSVIIADATSGFSDPDFWGEYNLIEPDKSIEIAIKKIQKSLNRSEN